jgi:hypothetical protein
MTRSESLATPVDLQAKLRSCLGAGSEDEAEEIASLCQLATPDSLPRLTAMLTAALYSATL